MDKKGRHYWMSGPFSFSTLSSVPLPMRELVLILLFIFNYGFMYRIVAKGAFLPTPYPFPHRSTKGLLFRFYIIII